MTLPQTPKEAAQFLEATGEAYRKASSAYAPLRGINRKFSKAEIKICDDYWEAGKELDTALRIDRELNPKTYPPALIARIWEFLIAAEAKSMGWTP